ncbi:MAG TPA: alpha/beta hydrolase [Bacteroidales bacterium]|nr:alpha/beta hydrolase [Bacteroidales bacterium]
METTLRSTELNGISISYLEKGEGKLLLFLHGFPDNAFTFQNQVDFFADRGYKVIAPFMRGYFPTTIPQDEKYYSVSLGKDIIELIKFFGNEKAIIVGHDWGATAAYAASIMNNERIEKLVAVSVPRGTFSKALITNSCQQRKSWYIYFFQTRLAEHAISYNDFDFIKLIWHEWGAKKWEIPVSHLENVIKMFKKEGVSKAAINYYRCFFDTSKLSVNESELLKKVSEEKIKVPTLYLHGSEDGCIGSELCDGTESFFDCNYEKKIIEGAGHFIHLEEPQKFNDIILSFIEK